ncbi:MAG: hypothetical protein ABIG96_00425 [Candidatus Micrarchaeota archaeon]
MGNLNFEQLKQVAPTLIKQEVPKKEYQVSPMFLPTDISSKKGTGVIKVVTRQALMNEKITHWVLYNSTRAATYIMGAVTLILLPQNIILAGVAGLATGYFYGKYKFYTFMAVEQPRHRWLLEGT